MNEHYKNANNSYVQFNQDLKTKYNGRRNNKNNCKF